jgi:hypothetical protein
MHDRLFLMQFIMNAFHKNVNTILLYPLIYLSIPFWTITSDCDTISMLTGCHNIISFLTEMHQILFYRRNTMSLKAFSKYIYIPAVAMLTIGVLTLSWLQLQISCIYYSRTELTAITFGYSLLGIVTNLAFLSIILIAINSLWGACSIFCGLTFILSVINHYTIQLHSSPLTLAELKNWRTAANVLSSYRLNLRDLIPLVIILAVQVLLIFCIKRLTQKKEQSLKKGWL